MPRTACSIVVSCSRNHVKYRPSSWNKPPIEFISSRAKRPTLMNEKMILSSRFSFNRRDVDKQKHEAIMHAWRDVYSCIARRSEGVKASLKYRRLVFYSISVLTLRQITITINNHTVAHRPLCRRCLIARHRVVLSLASISPSLSDAGAKWPLYHSNILGAPFVDVKTMRIVMLTNARMWLFGA